MTGAQALAAALAGIALLCIPPGPGVAARRLPVAAAAVSADQRGARRTLAWLLSGGQRRCVLVAGITAAIALLGVLPVPPALCGGLVAGLLTHLGWNWRAERIDARSVGAGAECVNALAAELRAGQPPHLALAAVSEHAAPVLRVALQAAARTAALGGDTAAALRQAAPTAAAAADLRRLSAGWAVSQSSGCSLATVLDTVQSDLIGRDQQQRLLAGLLAGPRATAGLLAVLPALGLAMGSALGARPWHVLTATGTGQLALTAGVVLDVLGVAWTARLVRAADRR